MKITVLDGFTENPGDLSWEWLKKCGDFSVYERTPPDLVAQRAEECEIIITNKTPLRKDLLKTLPKLKYIGLLSTGCNIVDCDYCKENGIVVSNIPTYSTDAVAQHTFALILEFTNAVSLHNNCVHSGEWAKSKDFCFWKTPLSELAEKTIGIIGMGKIGKAVAKIAKAFGMNVVAATNHPAPLEGVKFCSVDELLCHSDFVSIHCPLTASTEKAVNAEFLSKMKPTAILINTARGQIIDEEALAHALKNKIIAGAGLDVMACEPPEADNPLFGISNCIITPHIAWAGFETRERLMKIAEENLLAFLDGHAQNIAY